MAWNPYNIYTVAVIEVYPAATLQCYGIRNIGYTEKGQRAEREEILKGLGLVMEIQCDSQVMIQSADVLDSSVCLLAAKDFLNGDVYFPDDIKRSKKEGCEYSCRWEPRFRKNGSHRSGDTEPLCFGLTNTSYEALDLSRPCRYCGAKQPLQI